jgi:thymidine phosphorylase
MDVTFGNGAFMSDLGQAEELAHSIVSVAGGAGLVTTALLTDMNEVLGTTAGNALEVRETIDWLVGASDDQRLTEVVLALGAEMLVLGGLAADIEVATNQLIAVRADGTAAERFQAMVTALGGPADLVENPTKHLQTAPVTRRVDPDHHGYVQSIDTRSVGLVVVTLGGGRMRVEDTIDHAVGLSDVVGLGQYVDTDRPLAIVHARTESEAAVAADAIRAACVIGDSAPKVGPVVAGRITK